MNRPLAASLLIVLGAVPACSNTRSIPTSAAPSPGADACCFVAVPPGPGAMLNATSVNALVAALDDERRSQGFYNAVMERHGRVVPFSNIVRAEQNHERAVIALMDRHGVAVPDSAPTNLPAVGATIAECARAAAQIERDNIALYDTLIPAIHEADIRALFQNLRAASKDRHLPAFERWSADDRRAAVQEGGRVRSALARGLGRARGTACPSGCAGPCTLTQ